MSYFLGFLSFPVQSPVDVKSFTLQFFFFALIVRAIVLSAGKYEKQLRMMTELRQDRVYADLYWSADARHQVHAPFHIS